VKTTSTRAGTMAVIDTKTVADEVKKRAEKLKEKSLMEIGIVVMSDAKLLCAVQYGYLAASIQTASNDKITALDSPGEFAEEINSTGHDVETFKPIQQPKSSDEVLVGSAVDYAPDVEYGTRQGTRKTKSGSTYTHPGMAAQPFLRPALNMAYGKVPYIVKNGAKVEFGDYIS